MPKKMVAAESDATPGKRKGAHTPASLKAKADLLRDVASQIDVLVADLVRLKIPSLDIDGTTKFDRGKELLSGFVKNCYGSLAEEKFERGLV